MFGTAHADLRYGMRMLVRAPGFAVVAILTIALGIGANSAMFSIVNAVLLDRLPFPEPDGVVRLYTSSPQFAKMSTSYLNFLDWSKRARSFQAMAAFRSDSLNLLGQGQPERLRVAMVSSTFFAILGLKPDAGRTFSAEEDRRGGAPVVVLGATYWKTRFGGNPGIIGTSLLLNGVAYTVIGVVPTDAALTRGSQAYLPIGGSRDELFWDRSVSMGMTAVARLQPGVTVAQARAEMHTIAAALAHEYPAADKDKDIDVFSLREDLVGDVRPALLMLLGAVAFVLLIACVNVANLFLARAAARRREFAIRSAIGAGSGRLVRQILTEGLLLAFAGGVAGIALARLVLGVVGSRIAADLPRYATIEIDARVLAFTVVASLIAGAAFAAVPAWQTTRADANATLREVGREGSGRHRAQRVLVVGEIAIALMLTAAAGLMVRTMQSLWQVDPGFNPRGLLTFYTAGAPSSDPTPSSVRSGYDVIEQQIRAIPGVESASIVEGSVPMTGDAEMPFWVVGQPHATEQSQLPWALFYAVSAEYRPALGLELVRGRFITPQDTERSPFVIVIDEELARTVFGAANPIGEHLHFDMINVEYEIVGIVRHVRHWGLDSDATARIRSQMYFPFRQIPDAVMPLVANEASWVVRSTLPAGPLADQIKRTIFAAKPAVTMYGARTMEEIIAESLSQKRFARMLLTSFAALALVLAGIGIYGVMSQVVLQTRHEIGVRIAVGATPHAVLRMVLANAMWMAVIGISCGVAFTLLSTRLMQGLLYGVTGSDPVTVASVAAILGAVALVASLLPAWRATRVDPITMLRSE